MTSIDEPDFSHMDFSDDLIDKLWTQIKEHLRDEGRVYTYDLVTNDRIDYGDYSAQYIRNRVLPAMRERLVEQNIIETDQEIGEKNTGRLMWVLPE